MKMCRSRIVSRNRDPASHNQGELVSISPSLMLALGDRRPTLLVDLHSTTMRRQGFENIDLVFSPPEAWSIPLHTKAG